MRQLSDTELMAGIRAGGTQRRIYENNLYEKYQYFINEGTRKHRLSEDESASVYSDTILTVFESLTSDRFEGRSEFKTYLYQIFSNKCVDEIRKKTTKRSSVHDAFSLDESLMQLPDEARSVVQKLIAQSDVDKLHQHLRELGEKCRTMILSWGEGYSDDEIALAMGYNTAAVAKTSRLRCLDKLRERFRDIL
jgi:RNA polymerase sigma factor (sigma-70 family)